MVHEFNIDFNSLKIRGNTVSYNFKIVMQTDKRLVEQYCLDNYKELLQHEHINSPDDNLRLAQMKRYIKQKITGSQQDLAFIHKFFYDRNWFAPVMQHDNISKIEMIEFGAHMWTDRLPFLEMIGTITIDMAKMFEMYFVKGYVSFKKENKFIKEIYNIKFIRSMPLILTYMLGNSIREYILKFFNDMASRTGHWLHRRLVAETKIRNIHSYKKQFIWVDVQNLKLEINDTLKLIGQTVKKHYLPITVGGFIAYNYLKKRK